MYLNKLLGQLETDLNNGDARGYALKIPDNYMRENNIRLFTDWGGNGILAPDFTPNN